MKPPVIVVAVHEGAHAVVGASLGLTITRASIMATTDHAGAVWTGASPRSSCLDSMDSAMIAALQEIAFLSAGQVAEQIANLDVSERWTEANDPERESALVLTLLSIINAPPQWTADLRLCVAQCVRDYLTKHWPPVIAVAEALLNKRVLNGDEVGALLAAFDLPVPDLRRPIGLLNWLRGRYRRVVA